MRNLAIAALAVGIGAAAIGCSSTSAAPEASLPEPIHSATAQRASVVVAATTTTLGTTAPTTAVPTTARPTTTESTTTTSTIDPVRLAQLERVVMAAFEERARKYVGRSATGVSIALAHDSVVIGSVTLGRTARRTALQDGAKFRLASISKTLTAMAVVALVEQGAFSLDDTIATLWKGDLSKINKRAQQITVRELLQHTSGMSDMRGLFFAHQVEDWREAAAEALRTRPPNPPGAGYLYSNANYVILGVLVEQYTGKSAEEATRALVFAPLGITDAAFGTTKITDLDGPAYSVSNTRNFMESLGPAGAWTMSARSVALLFSALHPKSLQSPIDLEVRTEMRVASAPDGEQANPRYALGLEQYGRLWGHTGTLQGVRSIAFMLPNGYSVAVLVAGDIGAKAVELLDEFDRELDAARELPAH